MDVPEMQRPLVGRRVRGGPDPSATNLPSHYTSSLPQRVGNAETYFRDLFAKPVRKAHLTDVVQKWKAGVGGGDGGEQWDGGEGGEAERENKTWMSGEGGVGGGSEWKEGEEDWKAAWRMYDMQEGSGWDRLTTVHTVAPELIKYNPSNPLEVFFRLSGSALERVFQKLHFWLFLILHIVLALVYYFQSAENQKLWPTISTSFVAIPGSVLGFMMVFFLNQTFTRYVSLYNKVATLSAKLHEVLMFARVHLSHDAASHALPHEEFPNQEYSQGSSWEGREKGEADLKGRREARMSVWKLVASVNLVTYGSFPWNSGKEEETQEGEWEISEWVWWFLCRNGVMTLDQVSILRSLQQVDNGVLAPMEVLTWLEGVLLACYQRKYFDWNVASKLRQTILGMRTLVDELYTFLDGPIPFAYFSLLNFISLFYLFLNAYIFVTIAKYWSILAYFLVLVCYMGITGVANELSNPLGNDQIDIPIFHEAKNFFDSSVELMNLNVSFATMNPISKEAENEDKLVLAIE